MCLHEVAFLTCIALSTLVIIFAPLTLVHVMVAVYVRRLHF